MAPTPTQRRIGSIRVPREDEPIYAKTTRDIINALGENAISMPGEKLLIDHEVGDEYPLSVGKLSSTSVRVFAGYFIVAGKVDLAVAEADLVLSTNPAWIYVEWEVDTSTVAVKASASMPTSSAPFVRVRLAKFVPTNGRYYRTIRCRPAGDIMFAAPLR